jgi:hypothetical protein
MREALLGKLLPLLVGASAQQLAAIYRFLTGQSLPHLQAAVADIETMPTAGNGSVPTGARTGSSYQFHRKGRRWEIVFDGGQPFFLKDTLGIRYLNYLLHHPNEPISAFDLEVAIVPDKQEARALNSIQPQVDGRAKREYRQALHRLQAVREEAQAKGDLSTVSRLGGDIEALESALKDGGGPSDAGERARLNVHKAIRLVLSNLLSGGEDQRAFAQHVREAVSLGYKCLYNQSQGRIWE